MAVVDLTLGSTGAALGVVGDNVVTGFSRPWLPSKKL